MKILSNSMLLSLLFFSLQGLAAEKFILHAPQGVVVWHVTYSGDAPQTGKLPTDATLLLDPAAASKNHLEGKIALSAVHTGDDNVDAQLKMLSLLNEKYAYAYFKSNKFILNNDSTAKINGKIILLGVKIPVIINANFHKINAGSLAQKESLLFNAVTSVSMRSLPSFLFPKKYSAKGKFDIKIDAVLQKVRVRSLS